MAHSVRAEPCLPVAPGLPFAGGHMARTGRGRGRNGLPEGMGSDSSLESGSRPPRAGPSRLQGRFPRSQWRPHPGPITHQAGRQGGRTPNEQRPEPGSHLPATEGRSALRSAVARPQTLPRDERRRGRPAFVLFVRRVCRRTPSWPAPLLTHTRSRPAGSVGSVVVQAQPRRGARSNKGWRTTVRAPLDVGDENGRRLSPHHEASVWLPIT